MTNRPRLVLALAAALLVGALAGCLSKGGEAKLSNFSLEPERLGWNVGEEASFVLRVKGTTFSAIPNYTIDPDFAIEQVRYRESSLGLGGEYRTRNAADLNLRLWRNGTEVREAELGPGNESIRITLDVPEGLRDSRYTLELELFRVGVLRSEPFRVNIP